MRLWLVDRGRMQQSTWMSCVPPAGTSATSGSDWLGLSIGTEPTLHAGKCNQSDKRFNCSLIGTQLA